MVVRKRKEAGRQYGNPLDWAPGFRQGKTPAVPALCRTLPRFDAEWLELIDLLQIHPEMARELIETPNVTDRKALGIES